MECSVNDANVALEAARELAKEQPAIYQPRLSVLASRLSCLLALVAGPKELIAVHE